MSQAAQGASWVTTVGPVLAAIVSASITLIVFFKTRDIQSKLKAIDGQLKHLEIGFQYFQFCADNSDQLIERITAVAFRDRSNIELRSAVARLKVMLQSLRPLSRQELETLSVREFGVEADFTSWKEEIVDLVYERLFEVAKAFTGKPV